MNNHPQNFKWAELSSLPSTWIVVRLGEYIEEIKEKLVNTIDRLSLEINDLKKIKDHEKYMKAYNRINCYKVSLETA